MDFRDLNHTLALVCWLTELRLVEPLPVAENGLSQGTGGNPWAWCIELQRRLRTLVTWLDPSEGDVSKISAQASGSDSILGHADQLATRLAQMKLAASNESTWRQDPTVKTLAATLAKLVLERPKTYDPTEDLDRPSADEPADAEPEERLVHPLSDKEHDLYLTGFVVSLVRGLRARIEESGWRFAIRGGVNFKGDVLTALPAGELLAPAGFLPALVWAAEDRALRQQHPALWPTRWMRVNGSWGHHWGPRPAHMRHVVSWEVGDGDELLYATPSEEFHDLCMTQANHWVDSIWDILRQCHETQGAGHEVDLTDFLSDVSSSIQNSPRVHRETVSVSSGFLSLSVNYMEDVVHGNLLSHMVLFDQTPPPLGKDREENGSDIAKTLCKMPVRLASWPLESTWKALHEEFPWAKSTIDRIAMQARFGLRVGQAHFRLPPILLVGQAGCGKTRLAQRLGELCAIPNLTISAAGVLGGQVIQGTDRHWSNTEPSPVLRIIHQHGVANPLIVVDEIDKAAESSYHGSLQAALLPLLEYESARRFMDPCLTVPCDLSAVTWLLTANEITDIGGPLRSRVEIIEMDRPKLDHLEAIVLGVRRDLAKQWRVPEARVPAWDDASSQWVRQQIGPGSLFTAREAKRLIERRLMSTELTPTLTVVR